MIFSRDYLRVFIPLAICFAIYHLTFVPWINIKNYSTEIKWSTPVLTKTTDWWESLFVPDSWQRQNPQVIVTENGTFLYKEHVELSETRWRIKPLTILIPQKGAATNRQRALCISNPEGAEIQFKYRPDWTAEPPPVESGRLLGEILIYSPPSENSTDNGLQIKTSEVRIEKRQIWTPKPITMQMGDSLIQGEFLTINLEQKLLSQDVGAPPTQKTPFEGLESLELTYVKGVRIGLKDGGLWPSKDIADAKSRASHLILKCGGRFNFNFHHSEASLRGGVHMEHHVEGLPVDTFDCEDLSMVIGFHNALSNSTPSAQPSTDATRKKSPWRLDKLTALGAMGKTPTDRTRWMKLNAPGMKTEGMGQRLFMDMTSGEMSLSNTLPLTATQESSPVYLRRESMQIWSPEVNYGNPALFNQDEQTPPSAVQRLGTVMAKGPGLAQLETEQESWKLSWGQKLLVRPIEDLDVVTITGSANVSSTVQGTFMANSLDLWLRPTSPQRRELLAGYYDQQNVPQWLPEAMKAIGEVRVEAPELNGWLEQLNVKFEYPQQAKATIALPEHSSPIVPISSSTSLSNRSSPASLPMSGAPKSPAIHQPSQPWSQAWQEADARDTGAAKKRAEPFVVKAKGMDATVRSEGKKSVVQSLSLDGEFEMQRSILSESSPWPFSAKGKKLQMVESGAELFNMHLAGEPATICVGSGEIVAPELRLSQSDQLFHIDHPGTLVFPPEAIPLSPTTTMASTADKFPTSTTGLPTTLGVSGSSLSAEEGKVLRWVEAPRLQWNERMTFDGRTARFGGGVDLMCRIQSAANTISHIVVHAKTLAVDLVNPVPLSVLQNDGLPKAEVNQIRFEEDVDIKLVQTDLAGNRTSTEHMRLPRLDIFVPNQSFLGYGPGELWSRRFAMKGQVPGLSGAASPGSSSPELQCVHLSFMGRVEGDLTTRKASFFDRIEMLMGSIASWDDQVNVHRAERLANGQTMLLSDQLNIFDASELSYNQISPSNRGSSQANAWEVEALSRVRMESMSDKGRITMEGYSLKYAAKDDLVQMHGSPNQDALLAYPIEGEARVVETRFPNFSIQLKTGAIKGNISSIEAALPIGLQRAGNPTNPPSNNAPTLPSQRTLPNPRMPLSSPNR